MTSLNLVITSLYRRLTSLNAYLVMLLYPFPRPHPRVTAVALSVANPRDITIRWANMKHGYDQSVIDGFVVEWRQTSTYVINPDFTWLKAFMVPPTKVGVVAPEAAKMIADMEIEPVSVACDLANPRRKEY